MPIQTRFLPFLFVFLLVLLSGCSTATLIPMSNGQYQIVATGDSAEEAQARAMRKASSECDGEKVHVTNQNSAPESGSDRAKNYFDGGLVGLGSNLYEATLQFTCTATDENPK